MLAGDVGAEHFPVTDAVAGLDAAHDITDISAARLAAPAAAIKIATAIERYAQRRSRLRLVGFGSSFRIDFCPEINRAKAVSREIGDGLCRFPRRHSRNCRGCGCFTFAPPCSGCFGSDQHARANTHFARAKAGLSQVVVSRPTYVMASAESADRRSVGSSGFSQR